MSCRSVLDGSPEAFVRRHCAAASVMVRIVCRIVLFVLEWAKREERGGRLKRVVDPRGHQAGMSTRPGTVAVKRGRLI